MKDENLNFPALASSITQLTDTTIKYSEKKEIRNIVQPNALVLVLILLFLRTRPNEGA